MKLIVDMPMPVKEWNCLDCKAICTDIMRGHYCGITKKTIDTLKNMRARPDWCPIVGVLPEEHGDLIDRDRLEYRVMAETNPFGKPTIEYESGIKVMQMIEDAFTVIPAERKDYADN